ncbi:Tat pathway signal protein [Arthrobacter sp. SW1]|uniref:Tat pathway signal protein n=1 Tax=Arthrobacter sp. SW1 TaxID=1920889 RepID=UPI000877D43C|nr:Tat pathway signal protein [Arthrobacter sp. SW1]OFI37393.1 Tat pathway signal protein [Arthrobacter sp. SW1]
MDPNSNPANGEGQGRDGAPKPPPWQVPQPELRPELQQPGVPGGPQGAPPQGLPQQPPAVVDPFAREHAKQAAEAEHRKKRSQRRTVLVGLGVTALLAGTITAIVASQEEDADYAQVCFNEETGERVEDVNCGSSAGRSSGVYAWYFYSRGSSVPAIGQSRTSYPNYTRNVPSNAKTSTGYSSKGGTVSRGGFGGSSKGGSSGG